MGRNIRSIDPETVAQVEELLAKGMLQKKIAKKVHLDLRWISEISVAKKHRVARQAAISEEDARVQAAINAQDEEPPDTDTENYEAELRRKLRDAIPIRKRVRAIKELLDSPNAQLKKAGLDQLNAIEGIGKKASDKPYEPQPLFIIDTVPDFKPRERKKPDGIEEIDSDEDEGARAEAGSASPTGGTGGNGSAGS